MRYKAFIHLSSAGLLVLGWAGAVFGQALDLDAKPLCSSSAVAINPDDARITYRASFDPDDWSGDLEAWRSAATDPQSMTRLWSASSPDDHVVLTTVAQDNGNDKKQAAELSLGNFKNHEKIAFSDKQPNKACKKDAELCRQRIEDLRTGQLGAIVHSDPLYVGAPRRIRYPEADWPASYSVFATEHSDRPPMLYVGANDGMIHGFDASDGHERIAYLPYAMYDRLDHGELDASGHYNVDGSPIAGDVIYDGNWHTVLVVGMHSGGKSLFALDITEPEQFKNDGASTVLWEFSDAQLGYVYGQPSIVRLHNGRWVALFGNGYNSGAPSARLYAVALTDDSTPQHWEITTDSADSPPNGLGGVFPVDLDGDFITDYVYAGDLRGNLWRFDLTSSNPDDWDATKLFQTPVTDGNRQPITAAPQVGAHPYGLDYGVMVYFGTGQYLTDEDQDSDRQNTFYGVWDPDVFTWDPDPDTDDAVDRSQATPGELVTQSILGAADVNGHTYRGLSQNPVDYRVGENDTSYDRGWRIPLPEDGERVISNARLHFRVLSLTTTIPANSSDDEDDEDDEDEEGGPACVAGHGFLMVVSQSEGSRTDRPAFDLEDDGDFSLPGDAIDINDQAMAASGRQLDYGLSSAATHVSDQNSDEAFYILPSTGGGADVIQTPLFGRNGRVSWRELRR